MPLFEYLQHQVDVKVLEDVFEGVPQRLALQLALLQPLDGIRDLYGAAHVRGLFRRLLRLQLLDFHLRRLKLDLLLAVHLGPLVLLILHLPLEDLVFLDQSTAEPLRLLPERNHVRLMRPLRVDPVQLFLKYGHFIAHHVVLLLKRLIFLVNQERHLILPGNVSLLQLPYRVVAQLQLLRVVLDHVLHGHAQPLILHFHHLQVLPHLRQLVLHLCVPDRRLGSPATLLALASLPGVILQFLNEICILLPLIKELLRQPVDNLQHVDAFRDLVLHVRQRGLRLILESAQQPINLTKIVIHYASSNPLQILQVFVAANDLHFQQRHLYTCAIMQISQVILHGSGQISRRDEGVLARAHLRANLHDPRRRLIQMLKARA